MQGISRSVAGHATKIHLAVDAHGNAILFVLSDGITHDVKVAPNLIDQIDLITTEIVYADNGYDSDALRERIKQAGCFNNLPRKQNMKYTNNHIDWYLYKARHLI